MDSSIGRSRGIGKDYRSRWRQLISCAGAGLIFGAMFGIQGGHTVLASGKLTGATANVEGLPFAQGKSFATLEEYLKYLELLGTMDRPYYREIAPGIFELMGGSPTPLTPAKTIFTREELLEQFGFAR